MGIMSSRTGVVRYKTAGGDENRIAILEQLQRHSFREIEEGSITEESIGWVHLFDKDKANVPPDEHADGNSLMWDKFQLFSLRRDVRRVPGVVLRDEVKKTLDAWLKDNPGFFRVPKQKRIDTTETVKLKLLAKTLPIPTVWDAAWNSESGELFFFNTSPKAMDVFESMFRKTFNQSLRLVTPIEQAFAAALAFDMSNYNKATTASVLDLIRSNIWLGTLLGSWALATSTTEKMVVGQADNFVGIYTDRKIALVGAAESGPQKINITGSQEQVQAAKAALREGQVITELGLNFVAMSGDDEAEWSFSLDTTTFAIKSLKTPLIRIEHDEKDDAAASAEAALICKMGMVRDFFNHFDALLQEFITRYVTDRDEILETVRAFAADGHE